MAETKHGHFFYFLQNTNTTTDLSEGVLQQTMSTWFTVESGGDRRPAHAANNFWVNLSPIAGSIGDGGDQTLTLF